MVTETSDWLGEASLEADQSFQVLDIASASSPVDFEVPYGWYEGDTFHYYTDEQREQVRLAMLDTQPQPASSAASSRGAYSPRRVNQADWQVTPLNPSQPHQPAFRRTQLDEHQTPSSTVTPTVPPAPGSPLHHQPARTLANRNTRPVQLQRTPTHRCHLKHLRLNHTTLTPLPRLLLLLMIHMPRSSLPNNQFITAIKRSLLLSPSLHLLHDPLHQRGSLRRLTILLSFDHKRVS